MRRYRRVLRHRDFALLWLGAAVSALGDGMSLIALIWLLIERGSDSATVGWFAAAYTGPVVVGGLVAGIALDRFDRRRLLVADNLVRGLAIGSVPVASLLGVLTTAHVFAVAAIYGALFMVSLAGIPSAIPSLVDEDELTTANALESIAYGIAGLAGPAAAGIVIAMAGPTIVLLVDAATYGVFTLCLLAIRPDALSAAVVAGSRPGGGIAEAIRFIVRTPAIVAITLMFMCLNVAEGMLAVFLPIFTRDMLGGAPSTYGILASSITLGILGGSLLVGAIRWRWPLGRSIAVAQTLTGVAFLGLLGPAVIPWLAGVLAIGGLFGSSLTAWAQTVRMRLIPPELRGRVFATLRTLMQATGPVGAVLAGVVLADGAFSTAVLIMAGVGAIPGAIGLMLPALGRTATAEPERTAAT